jgi:hypothetical protein
VNIKRLSWVDFDDETYGSSSSTGQTEPASNLILQDQHKCIKVTGLHIEFRSESSSGLGCSGPAHSEQTVFQCHTILEAIDGEIDILVTSDHDDTSLNGAAR